jgi:glycosyltransferase involved in cell wall biosynthesis
MGLEKSDKMNVVVLIPCYNEEKTIGKVVRDFKSELPDAEIVVFDNNSSDGSAKIAMEQGARVVKVKRQGKGYVVRKMFETVNADIYVLVDGDDTYVAKDVHKLIKPVEDDHADMAIGRRILSSGSAMKSINRIGNEIFSNLMSFCFLKNVKDVLSGYRVINSHVAKNIPLIRHEFQVEMEMTVQCLYRGYRVAEVPVGYKERPNGSFSKLHPIQDGGLIMLTLLALIRDLRPLEFFGFISVILMILVFSYGLFVYFSQRMATLLDTVIIISVAIIAWLFMSMGLFLHTINRRFIELVTLLKKNNAEDD